MMEENENKLTIEIVILFLTVPRLPRISYVNFFVSTRPVAEKNCVFTHAQAMF